VPGHEEAEEVAELQAPGEPYTLPQRCLVLFALQQTRDSG
jgi:hypothetical protein